MILDNARYCPSKSVEEYRQDLGAIVFLFLPTYSPHLNLIERLWKFLKRQHSTINITKNLQISRKPVKTFLKT
ncbi:MAG: transposase [Planctomycetaceae bacterium]|nr:transposase [Planctomycetaceae bacterium]